MVPKLSALVLLATLVSSGLGQDAKVYKKLPVADLEAILKSLDIEYEKTQSPTKKNLVFFTFERKKFKLALHYSDGDDVMLVAEFPALPLAAINRWNRGTRYSRAVLYQDKTNEYTTLEANLDITAGVTDDTVRHFIRRYDDEVKKFAQLMYGSAVRDEEVVTKVTSDHLEKILKNLGIRFKKTAGKEEGVFTYEFERDAFKIRLHNFKGADLMLDAAFKEIPLEEVNKYNSGRKFIRAVLYQPDRGKKYTALEANLDCVGGVSDNVIRYFIGTFDGELNEFAKFIAKVTAK
jgi:Putative bacterial sensory transduction regulator